jgi:membrane-bound lytic murein transglycosylase B
MPHLSAMHRAPCAPRPQSARWAAMCAALLLTTGSPFVHAQSTGAPQVQPPPGQSFEEEIVPQRYAHNSGVDAFINDMVARYDFDRSALQALFAQVNYSATAAKLVTSSATPATKNWRAYQARFLDPARINAGMRFWRANRDALRRASARYGVPPEAIVGIIGVETIYGRYMGNFRIIDALTTLSFDYPPTPNRDTRQATFRKNLEDFLVWTRNSGTDPMSVQGSYAGAIGIPQFMPSSILQYAVDFDGDGKIDLTHSSADAIGSVASFLQQHGWETGRPVVWRIAGDEGSLGIAAAACDGKPEPSWALQQMLKAGMLLDEPDLDVLPERATPVVSVDLPTPGRPTEYVLGLRNFYVLTRYNRSFFYALAAHQLGQQIRARLADAGDLVEPPPPPAEPDAMPTNPPEAASAPAAADNDASRPDTSGTLPAAVWPAAGPAPAPAGNANGNASRANAPSTPPAPLIRSGAARGLAMPVPATGTGN